MYGYGNIGGGSGQSKWSGTPYPSPFATQGSQWTPMHITYLMDTCKYYYLKNPLISAATTKMATYPITEIIVSDQDKSIRDFYESYFTETIDLHTHLIEAGLDYNVYGNMMSSVMFPFVKYLTCRSCGHKEAAKHSNFSFNSGRFSITCKKCNNSGQAKSEDVYMKNPNGIRIMRWCPSDFTIILNEATGERIYKWKMPSMMRHDIMTGKPHVVANTPQEFLDAVRENRTITFPENKLFHMRRPSISSQSLGKVWGVPMILPVLEDVFYLQILRKAQEQIASEHLVPLRILFPQGTGAGDQPYSMMNLNDWKSQVQEELTKYRQDRNYVPVLPVPVGNQTVSGDGRALLLHQEIRAISEQIVAGMNVPIEFVFGGLSYSGSSVSMRMLENSMLNYRQTHLRYMKWIMRQISDYMGWPFASLELRDFRMADDLNRRQYIFNLWQAGLLCDQSLLEESGFDAAEQKEKRKSEEKAKFSEQERMMLAQAKTQNKASRIQAIAQMELQTEMQQKQMQQMGGMGGQSAEMAGAESQLSPDTAAAPATPGNDVNGGMTAVTNILDIAKQLAQKVLSLPPDQRAFEMASLSNSHPELGAEVSRLVMEASSGVQQQQQQQQMPQQQTQGGSQQEASAPLPEQRPPTREADSAMI